MTIAQIAILSVVLIIDFNLSIIYPIYDMEGNTNILVSFNILRMILTWGLITFIVVTLNNSAKPVSNFPKYEKLENVYKLKQ